MNLAPERPNDPIIYQTPVGSGLQVTSIVAGIFAVLLGLVPIFFLGAWAFGITAIVVGWMAYRRAKPWGVKQGRAGMILGCVALVLGIIGISIVASVTDELDRDLTCLDEADTIEEMDACNE